ncbi:unnamed protein product [Parajaminaea phylloscopi]
MGVGSRWKKTAVQQRSSTRVQSSASGSRAQKCSSCRFDGRGSIRKRASSPQSGNAAPAEGDVRCRAAVQRSISTSVPAAN